MFKEAILATKIDTLVLLKCTEFVQAVVLGAYPGKAKAFAQYFVRSINIQSPKLILGLTLLCKQTKADFEISMPTLSFTDQENLC